ncbi:cation-translocating P-type ATPase [Actinokineospora sp. HUAS TT18]|uniref:cation-translocating P-type ATPase n=1 Tax=Actinokineospora sp. HUAS TT18 TaxID=3447451 RepID=UPI003F522285
MTAIGVPTGLTRQEAADVFERVGPNSIAEPSAPGLAARALAQARDPMILLLLAAMVLAAVLGDWTDTAVIAFVVVANSAVGIAQEVRAERALAALRRMSAPTARVVRDGVGTVLPADQVVPGDVITVDAGDIVPADARLSAAHRLQVDESMLTGESVAVDKLVGDEVSAGTVVTKGRGVAVVVRTGATSSLGRIAALLDTGRVRPTPLQRRLAALGRVLALVAVLLSAGVAAIGLIQGRSLGEVTLTGISLAVAAVPESLPAVVTLALALGAHQMARRGAVVRALPAVETLGSVTIIAADKTGTLTEGRMVVERLWTPEGGEHVVTGTGYEPDGEIRGDGRGLDRLLRAVALCNDADLSPPDTEDPRWRSVGDPTEAALLVAAGKGAIPVATLRAGYPRVAEVPFDAQRRTMTTTHRTPDSAELVVCKGAPEAVFAHLAPGADTDRALGEAARLAAEGYRVLAVTEGADRPRLVGLVAITDPPRSDVADVIAGFHAAGVRTVMITGDHPETASVIAARVGIGPGPVVTGDHLDGMADHDAAVYARTRPDQKLRIVEDWQRDGHVVAMTGDGVNDAPALRRADIGVAMGLGGTEVARQAADLVLTDDNLATVAVAIGEGRRVYANVRTFLRYALAGGFAEILVMLLGPLAGLALPLLPAQILWVNLLTHGLPGVAIGAEPASPDLMRLPPRPPGQFVLGDGLWRRIGWTGALIAAVTLAVGAWGHATGRPWQSMVFLCLGLAQLGVAVSLRARGGPRFLDIAVAAAVALQLAGVYVGGLRALLGTVPVGLADLAVVAVAALVPGIAVAATRWSRAR